MTVTLVVTLVALLVNGIALVALESLQFRDTELARARTQAGILARSAAAAIAFDDRREAEASLRVLERDAEIRAAALYGRDGRLFASFAHTGTRVPALASDTAAADLRVEGERIAGFQPVRERDGRVGTVYLDMRYGLYERLASYIGLLVAVMCGALLIALFLSSRLERAVTRPILAVTEAAQRVVRSHDYSERVAPQAGLETGLLAEAFNQMLAEIDRRASEVLRQMGEREKAEAALRAADRQKDRFLALLAHELRNPLAPIGSAVQILKQKGGGGPEEAYAREVMDRQLQHLARLLDDLLDVSRITNNKLELRRQRVALGSIVETAVETSRPPIDRKGQRLEVRVADPAAVIDGDPMRLAQALANLLNNAARYSHPGGRIEIDAQARGREAVIRVRDDGIGIAPEELSGVFDIFSQSASALRHAGGGLGLGLFLVRSLVSLHGGRVEARSAGLGKGSEFEIRLPLAVPQRLPAGEPAALAPAQKRRILVVDDNVDAAVSLAMMLSLSGHELEVAHGGTEALVKAGGFKPQVVLLDLGMPGMDGYETARHIRQTDWGSRALLVAVSGWGQEDDRRRALESGFDSHLTKPASPVDLQTLLASAAAPLAD